MLRLTGKHQEYIASNAYSLAEAYVIESDGINRAMPYAIYNDDIMVGFVMAVYQPIDINDPEDDEDAYYLARLMIDKKYQGKGYGKEAMKKIIDTMKACPYGNADAVVLSCSRNNTIAYELYKSLGFIDTGKLDDTGDYYCRLDFK